VIIGRPLNRAPSLGALLILGGWAMPAGSQEAHARPSNQSHVDPQKEIGTTAGPCSAEEATRGWCSWYCMLEDDRRTLGQHKIGEARERVERWRNLKAGKIKLPPPPPPPAPAPKPPPRPGLQPPSAPRPPVRQASHDQTAHAQVQLAKEERQLACLGAAVSYCGCAGRRARRPGEGLQLVGFDRSEFSMSTGYNLTLGVRPLDSRGHVLSGAVTGVSSEPDDVTIKRTSQAPTIHPGTTYFTIEGKRTDRAALITFEHAPSGMLRSLLVRTFPPASGGPPSRLSHEELADTVSLGNGGFSFEPTNLTVRAGTTVVWRWTDPDHHSTTSDKGLWDSGVRRATSFNFRFRFDKSGVYPYHCNLHGGPGSRGMSGVITVLP
jgi:plastocyanin